MFHSSQRVTLQIDTTVVALHKNPEISRALVPGTIAYKLHNQMTKKFHQPLKHLRESILCGVNTVGLLQKDTLTVEEELIIRKRLSAINVSYSFDRIYFKRVVIHSISYRYMLKINTFTVIYKSHFGSLYGHVQKYVKVLFASSCPDQCLLWIVHLQKVSLPCNITNAIHFPKRFH